MTAQWFYSIGNEQSGPVTEIELKRLLQTGKVNSTSLVWKEGMAAWTPAGQVSGLIAGPPPLPGAPPPLHAPPPAPRLRHTLRFESQVPKPVLAKPAAPPPIAIEPVVTGAPALEKPKPKPSRPALKMADTAITLFFVLLGAMALAAVAGIAGSEHGVAVFALIIFVCYVAFWVRVSLFLYNAWSVLPWKHRSIKPLLAAASLWASVFSLGLIFWSVRGLSGKTNEALHEKGQKRVAPEPLGVTVCVAYVLTYLMPLVLPMDRARIPSLTALLFFHAALIALTTQWLVRQGQATNLLIGHEDAPSPSLGVRIAVLSSGAVSLVLALVMGAGSLRDQNGFSGPGTSSRQNLLGALNQSTDLQEMIQQEAMRNQIFAEQLRNIRYASSGGRIQWSYPPQTQEEARLRKLIEDEARRNADFLNQLHQIRDAYQPAR